MDKSETLRLFNQGQRAWNAWAERMRSELEQLRTPRTQVKAQTDWEIAATADFQDAPFSEKASFAGFIFPGRVSFKGANLPKVQFQSAKFLGEADFSQANFASASNFDGATFSHDADFYSATFHGQVSFQRTIFQKKASFKSATFRQEVKFVGTHFHGYAWFERASFKDTAHFRDARAARLAYFSLATFADAAEFGRMVFSGGAGFTSAKFNGFAFFANTKFERVANFSWVKFSNRAIFNGSHFRDDAQFIQCQFEGVASFIGVRFEKTAEFTAVDVRSAFSLASAAFFRVPDFIQAHFAEAPQFDEVSIEKGRIASVSKFNLKSRLRGDPDIAARWRALKRLAIQGHDHEREQAFFKEELKARRWTTDKPWHWVFVLGVLYEWFSDFGRSVIRPVLWLVAGIVAFGCAYLDRHLALVGQSISSVRWLSHAMGKWLRDSGISPRYLDFPTLTQSDPPPLTCIAGDGNPAWSAFDLSIRKALIFVGHDSNEKLNQIYACLYGIFTSESLEHHRLSGRFSPVIPDGVASLGLLQLIYSVVLIFLFLLAVRNHFRIK